MSASKRGKLEALAVSNDEAAMGGEFADRLPDGVRASQGSRALRACVMIACAIAVAVAADRVGRGVGPSVLVEARTLISDVKGERLSASAGLTTPGSPELEVFESELFSLAGFSEVRATADGSIVGFVAKDDAANVYERVSARLMQAGWVEVESGLPTVGSFVKAGGLRTWALVSCSGVGAATSVVVQCV